ncbi:hypothetical protein DAPPUDRAFT_254379 [Daphnia pulex]|uniref:CUB domain-containing protein n=1 Tax=Daphnia pulex TaxID=6669 RepID=E9H716_DAPPU|nr:hypothetical protein DAPPUDRAFT_254379 [Daphnia pulex]|eukprot:EFX72521.1 hypothetical protein DAPPUDRAFT_254379 [Daphnia pulex]
MRHLVLLFSLVLSVTVADDSAKDFSQNSCYITVSPITLAETTLATSLNSSGNDEDYYRKNSRPANAVKKSTTVKPVVRRPATTTRRPRPTRHPAETKDPVHSWDQADTCGGNILVPLSDDQNNKVIEETYRSTSFPIARTYPSICTWNVKVRRKSHLPSKFMVMMGRLQVSINYRHGRIVLRLDERSRLPNDKECTNGYIRVSPFMKEAKICGRIGDVPPLQWHVEDQQPETVTISMRNMGLEEDKSTGLSFTLQDTCGGTIHVPLIFDRLSFHESSHFFTERNYPLVCIWNVSPLCRRTRVTMRVDVQSRLADVDGCTKGYYTVTPIMKEAKLCGRIGTVPPFQWYVDDQKLEDVSIVIPDIKKIDVDIEKYWSTTRWVNRLREESVKGDRPRLITPGIFGSTTISSILPNTQNFNKTTSNHFEDQSDITWVILKPLSDTKISSSSNVVPNVVSNEIVAPAAIHSSISPVNNLPKIPPSPRTLLPLFHGHQRPHLLQLSPYDYGPSTHYPSLFDQSIDKQANIEDSTPVKQNI